MKLKATKDYSFFVLIACISYNNMSLWLIAQRLTAKL